MKKYLLFVITIFAFYTSCKTERYDLKPIGSLSITNAIIGGGAITINTNKNDSVTVNSVKSYSFIPTSNTIFSLYPSRSVSTVFYNSEPLPTQAGEIYSFFAHGYISNPEIILMKEKLKEYRDSVVSIRFANLSPNSVPVNVTLSGTPNVKQFSNIEYKQISEFRQFAAGPSLSNAFFNFQVRNANTDAVLATYTFTSANLSSSRFKNVTLVYRGVSGGTGNSAPGITFVQSY